MNNILEEYFDLLLTECEGAKRGKYFYSLIINKVIIYKGDKIYIESSINFKNKGNIIFKASNDRVEYKDLIKGKDAEDYASKLEDIIEGVSSTSLEKVGEIIDKNNKSISSKISKNRIELEVELDISIEGKVDLRSTRIEEDSLEIVKPVVESNKKEYVDVDISTELFKNTNSNNKETDISSKINMEDFLDSNYYNDKNENSVEEDNYIKKDSKEINSENKVLWDVNNLFDGEIESVPDKRLETGEESDDIFYEVESTVEITDNEIANNKSLKDENIDKSNIKDLVDNNSYEKQKEDFLDIEDLIKELPDNVENKNSDGNIIIEDIHNIEKEENNDDSNVEEYESFEKGGLVKKTFKLLKGKLNKEESTELEKDIFKDLHKDRINLNKEDLLLDKLSSDGKSDYLSAVSFYLGNKGIYNTLNIKEGNIKIPVYGLGNMYLSDKGIYLDSYNTLVYNKEDYNLEDNNKRLRKVFEDNNVLNKELYYREDKIPFVMDKRNLYLVKRM